AGGPAARGRERQPRLHLPGGRDGHDRCPGAPRRPAGGPDRRRQAGGRRDAGGGRVRHLAAGARARGARRRCRRSRRGLRRDRRRRPRRCSRPRGVRGVAEGSDDMSEILLVDAFARRALEGNQEAVLALDGPADDGWMQSLAGELGYGATCFYRDGELRWFSPTLELTLCGHGTLATSHVLWERGPARDEHRFSTVAGELTARRHDGGIEVELPAQPAEPAEVPGLAEALG